MTRERNPRHSTVFLTTKRASGVLAVVLAVCGAGALSSARPPGRSAAAKGQLERGRYLVQRVGLCEDCHTPMDQQGRPIEARALQGARIAFKPIAPIPGWAEVSVPIAGLPGFTDAQAVAFLTTGKDVSGKFARPPMPAYRFSRRDAGAVAAYLRSLAPKR